MGIRPDYPTPVADLAGLVEASTDAFARTVAAALPRLERARLEPVGSHFAWP